MPVIDKMHIYDQNGAIQDFSIGAEAKNVTYDPSVSSTDFPNSINTQVKNTLAHTQKIASSGEDVHGFIQNDNQLKVKNPNGSGYIPVGSGDGDMKKSEFVNASGYIKISAGGTGNDAGYIRTGALAGSIIGNKATAEGEDTTSSGTAAHAEGKQSLAIGNYSHAEGYDTNAIGNYSHAEGYNTYAEGHYSHAEGDCSLAIGNQSHAEGYATNAIGYGAHCEGGYSTATSDLYIKAYGDNSHAEGLATYAEGHESHTEGYYTTATGIASHAEGGYSTSSDIDDRGTFALGINSHAEGVKTTAYGEDSHAEGYKSYAKGNGSHAEGGYTTVSNSGGTFAIGDNSHAEGYFTTAFGPNSHAEGFYTYAIGKESHAEGGQDISSTTGTTNPGTFAIGTNSHSEGQRTSASGDCSHAEGETTYAVGDSAHAEGYNTYAYMCSHAEGQQTSASNFASHAGGHFNAAMTTGGSYNNTVGTAFVIGNGTLSSNLSNAFSVQYDGTVRAKSSITGNTTADYAEFFEQSDNNTEKEDRVGYFVTFDNGKKIKIASAEDSYILGIISGAPFVVGNGDCDTWTKMELRDEFNRVRLEPAPLYKRNEETGKDEQVIDDEGNPVYQGTKPVYNPDYDPSQSYIPRDQRPEWAAVGMLGVLPVRDDGTCEVNGYCTVTEGGIATKATNESVNKYRVIGRKTENVVEVVFR